MTGGAAVAVEADSTVQTQAQKLQQVSQSLPQSTPQQQPQAQQTTQVQEPKSNTIAPEYTKLAQQKEQEIANYNYNLENYKTDYSRLQNKLTEDTLAFREFASQHPAAEYRPQTPLAGRASSLLNTISEDQQALSALVAPTPPTDVLGNPLTSLDKPFAVDVQHYIKWELPAGISSDIANSPYAGGFTYPTYQEKITYSDLTTKDQGDPNPPNSLVQYGTNTMHQTPAERLSYTGKSVGQTMLFNEGYGDVVIKTPDVRQFGGSTASGMSGAEIFGENILRAAGLYGINDPTTQMLLRGGQAQLDLKLGVGGTLTYPVLESQVAEAKQNALRPLGNAIGAGPSTPLSTALGSSLGQEATGYITRSTPTPPAENHPLVTPAGDSSKAYGGLAQFQPNPDVIVNGINVGPASKNLSKPAAQNLVNTNPVNASNQIPQQKVLGTIIPFYSPEQSASLVNAIKTNPEYGGNQSFLVGNIGTENSTGSLAALNITQQRNAAKTSTPSDISSLGPSETNQFVLSGKHVLPEGLVFVPSEADIERANMAREQQFLISLNNQRNKQINAGIDNLVAYDQSIQDLLIKARIETGGGNLDIFETEIDKTSVFPTHENKTTPLTFGLINVNPETTKLIGSISTKNPNAKNQLEDILSKSQGKEITVAYQPVESVNAIGTNLDFVLPNEKTQLGQKIDWNNPNSLRTAATLQQIGLPLSAIPETIQSFAFGTVGLLTSLPFTSHIISNIFSKEGFNVKSVTEASKNLYTPEAIQFIQSGKINPNESPTLVGGATTFFSGKGLGGFTGGYGVASDVVALGTDTFLTLFGLQEAVPLRYTRAVAKVSEGLTKDVSLGSALTVGYKEGGSGRVLVYKSPEGKISFGTPEPSTYLPEQLPVSMSGRGFTRSEGGGLLNHLLNSDQALAYQQSKNILTAQDVELIKAARNAVPLIVKAPVTVFHNTFGTQPLSTVSPGAETTALKEIIKTGQSKLGLGSQYGSFSDIPFVPGKVNVGDLDLAVSNPQQQNLIGSFSQDMLNKATGNKVPLISSSSISKTPQSPLDLVIDNQLFGVNTMKVGEPERLFKYEEGGVNLYEKGISGKTKIIDLPIKGLNEEGGIMENYHQVFGVEEPIKTYNIEGIKTMTPHYNTVRRLTTVTRQGNKEMKSAIPGFGLTTKYGDYTGMEIGRMKDAARSYRGIILASKEYRKVGKINEADILEHSANVIKRRFQHVYNFKEALNEISGEIVINKLPESKSITSSFINKSKLPLITKQPFIINELNKNTQELESKKSFEKPTSIVKHEPLKYELKSTIHSERSLITKNISESPKYIVNNNYRQSQSISAKEKPSLSSKAKSVSYNYPEIYYSSSMPSKSQNVPITSKSKSPASNLGKGELKTITGLPFVTQKTSKIKNLVVKDFVKDFNRGGKGNGGGTLPGIATKPDERVIRKEPNRFNYLGNSTESTLVGLYNRQETIYGNKKIHGLVTKDYNRTTKGYPKLITTKTTGLISTKKTSIRKRESKPKKNKTPRF